MTPLPYPDARELSRIAQRGETAIGENGGQVQLALDAIGPGDAQRYWPGCVDGNDRRQLAGRLRFRRVMGFIRHGDNPVPSPSVSPTSFSISARSEERPVGEEFVITCSFRWSPFELNTIAIITY